MINILLNLMGTFLMFLGFFFILTGIILFRLKQEDMGRMFLSTSFVAGGEMPEGRVLKFFLALHGNEALKRQSALGLLLFGGFISVIGAAIG